LNAYRYQVSNIHLLVTTDSAMQPTIDTTAATPTTLNAATTVTASATAIAGTAIAVAASAATTVPR
jgi:hypothetical protein